MLRAINSNYRYRIVLPEELISITETDFHYRDRSVEISAEISHCRYRFPLEFQFIFITDADFGLETRVNSVIISATTVITNVGFLFDFPQKKENHFRGHFCAALLESPELTPDSPQSHIAPTNLYDSGGNLGEEFGDELGEIFCAVSCFICCAE